MLRRQVPWASLVRKFLRVLLEVEAGRDQAIGDRLVRGVVGKIHLVVSQKTSVAMDIEIRSRNHGQVVGIGGMKQSVEAGKAGSLFFKIGQICDLACYLVVHIF